MRLPFELAGLSAGVAATLLIVGVAVLTALHLVRARRERVVVPFAPLWLAASLADAKAPRLSRRVARWMTLAIKLLIFSLAIAAASDPHRRSDGAHRTARTCVILIDRSASMGATDEQPTRLARAQQIAREVVAQLSPGDAALIASFATTVIAHSGFETDRQRLDAAIARIEVSDEPADAAEAAAFGTATVVAQPHPAIVLISDDRAADAALRSAKAPTGDVKAKSDGHPIERRFIGVGRRRQNVGITSFVARRTPHAANTAQASVVVANALNIPADVKVELHAATTGMVLAERPATVPAGGSQSTVFDDFTSPPDGRIEARLFRAGTKSPQGPAGVPADAASERGGRPLGHPAVENLAGDDLAIDDLAIDDLAFAVIPPRRTLKVLVAAAPNLYLDGALFSLGSLVATTRAPIDVPLTPDAIAPYDVVIIDGAPLGHAPVRGRFLFIDPHGPASPWPNEGSVVDPVVSMVDREHPVGRHLALSDLNVSSARRLTVGPSDHIVVGSARAPLVVAREAGALRAVAVAFDLRRSDLPMRPAFPLLVANALTWLATQPKSPAATLSTGHAAEVTMPANGDHTVHHGAPTNGAPTIGAWAQIHTPDGRSLRVPIDGETVTLVPDRVGFYQLDSPGRARITLAANLSSQAESDTQPPPTRAASIDRPPGADGRADGRADTLMLPPWWWLALATMLLAAAEWVAFRRRWTV